MKVKDIASVKVGKEEANFFMVRRGSHNKVGLPTKDFSEYHISVTVFEIEVIDPTFLFYGLTALWSRGYFRSIARGTTNLVHITCEDVRNIRL